MKRTSAVSYRLHTMKSVSLIITEYGRDKNVIDNIVLCAA